MKSIETYTKSFYGTNLCIVNGYKFDDGKHTVSMYGEVKCQDKWSDFSMEPTYEEYSRLLRISERKDKLEMICQKITKT